MYARKIFPGLVFFLLWARPANAAYVTGTDLLRNCESQKPEAMFACVNYIAAVIDFEVMMQSLGTEPATDFCLPKDLPIQKAQEAVVEYLKKSPQNASFIAVPAVTLALQAAYPCAPPAPPKAVKKKKKHHG